MERNEIVFDGGGSLASSGGSTPEPPTPFCPKFGVLFTDRITKDGESIKYRVQVCQNGEIVQVIERIYEDFQYLEHCVITDQPFQGLIIPPLPFQVAVDAQSAESYTKKQMGQSSKALLGDDFKKHAYQLQKYLELLLSHPILGRSPRLQEFLLNKDPPPRIKVRKGIVSKLSESLETRKINHPDCEDFFQKEREWTTKYNAAIKDFSTSFNDIVYSEIKLTSQLEQISVAVRLNEIMKGSPSFNVLNRFFVRFLDATKNEIEEKTTFEDYRICTTFELWSKYVEAEETMLLRRNSLMMDYQACNRALEKAKPNRKQAAEVSKKESEEAFEKCTEDARREIKRFHMLRSKELLETMDSYVQFEINFARNYLLHLSAAVNSISSLSI